MNSFDYKREVTVFKLDEKGNKIPLYETVQDPSSTRTDGTIDKVIPGKFETETKWVEDYVNLDTYVRAVTLEDGKVVLMLNDGHEESREVGVLKNKRKPPTPDNVTIERQRQFVCSEIIIALPEDIERLRAKLKG
jgi:hypothetical protein